VTAEIIRLSAQRDSFYVPAFELLVSGQAVGEPLVKDIIEVKYDDAIERIDGFTLTVNNWDAQRRAPIYYGHYAAEPTPEHPDLFEPGNELVLCMGYEGSTRLMVAGVITSVDVQFAESGHSKLVVSGLNVLERFRRQQYTWSWPDSPNDSVRDSDVALALAAAPNDTEHRPGLGIEVRIDEQAREREPFFANIFMNNQYPILFLMERARARGYQVILREEDGEEVDEDGYPVPVRHIFFGPTHLERDVTYVLEWGKTLTSFHPTFANSRQVYSVKVCGWDRTAKRPIEVCKTLDDIPEDERPNRDHIAVARTANRQEVITQPPARTVQEAELHAIEQLKRNQLGMVEASGSTIGLPDLRAGKIVHIRGVGRHFDGIYTVTTTSHVINEQGYRTNFTAKRANPEQPGAHFAADLVEGG
jgi:phage protein D